jgi:hypothetical protein
LYKVSRKAFAEAGSRPRTYTVFGDHLQAFLAVAVVLMRVVAGTFDPHRPDQVQEIRELKFVAVIGIPTGDVQDFGVVNAALLRHLALDLFATVFRQASLDHREMAVREIRERRSRGSQVIGAESRPDSHHDRSSSQ